MKTIKRISLPVYIFILLGVFACALPQIPLVDPNAASTSVAQTVDAIIQLTRAAAEDVDLLSSDTPTLVPSLTPTSTASLTPTLTSTATFTPTFTLTPTAISTVTPLVPLISVSIPTNCRLGPGKIYDMVGALLVGETVPVFARDPASNYWYIRDPDSPSQFCWVWGEYATVTGITSALPVYTPPPPPTATRTTTPWPGFNLAYDGLDSCSAWWIDVELRNTGVVTYESISMTVKDTVTSTVVANIADGFTDKTNCSSTLKKTLLPGKVAITSSPQFSYDPNGHKLKVTVTLCSDTGLNGTCTTEMMTVTP